MKYNEFIQAYGFHKIYTGEGIDFGSIGGDKN
jgi:hypothetical protein